MGETVIYPGRWGTAWMTGLFVALAVGAVVVLVRHGFHLGSGDWKLVVVAPLGLVACVNRWRAVVLHYPRLRITREYVEGGFGRVRWTDVASVSTRMRWSGYAGGRRIVITLNPGARIEDAQQPYVAGPGVGMDRVRDGRLEIAGGGFDRSQKRVLALLDEAWRSRHA